MLDVEFNYYKENQDEIVKAHLNEYVTIRERSVLGYYKTENDALIAMKEYEPGTYMVHLCQNKGEDVIHYSGYWSEVA